ncbi:MAG: hypothetical protein HOV87_20005 [Catenulispora sp.]|nr:hypothetical protein [Catenulispora sp.]
MADLEAALADGAEDPGLLFRRGVSRRALGDEAGAREDWLAHLMACGDEGPPFVEEIRAQAPEILTEGGGSIAVGASAAVSMP